MRDYSTHNYGNISKEKVDAILNALAAHGSQITGSNPWAVDTRKHGVKLKGEWNEVNLTLTVTITDAGWYVPNKAVWENIDSLMSAVQDAG